MRVVCEKFAKKKKWILWMRDLYQFDKEVLKFTQEVATNCKNLSTVFVASIFWTYYILWIMWIIYR